MAISAACSTIAPTFLNILITGLDLGYFPNSWQIFITATI
jgi:hypothetical protein